MPGPFLKQIVWTYCPPPRSPVRQFLAERYGSEYDKVFLYACSTPAQNANHYRVWLIPEPLATVSGKAYKYLGVLPEVLSNLYGSDVGNLPADIVYPEDYMPESDIYGIAYVFSNWEGKLDYYFQFYKDLDTPNYVLFKIDAESIEDWYAGIKNYIGEVTVDGWVRPYRPPTPSCYGRLENYFRDWREWAQF